MKRALIIRNIVDLNAEPDFHSERKTQLLFGELVTVEAYSGDYSRVRRTDGYSGWARTAALEPLNAEDENNLKASEALKIVSPIATVFDEQGSPVAPYFLSYGSTVYQASGDEGVETMRIIAPNGAHRRVYKEDICKPSQMEEHTPEGLAESIICSAVQFLGAPYLWGGNSALGLDCSSLVQLVYGMHGVELPRDTKDQRKLGAEVPRAQIQPGDLIFSPGHVVIYMGENEFVHSSLGEGGVEINSYDPTARNYRADLDKDFQTARRHW